MKGWIRERGPMTVAAFMDTALYHPDFGYYARAVQRSGRAGDFFTSVDVGPLFGELIAKQIVEMAAALADLKVRTTPERGREVSDVVQAFRPAPFDLVEAGAGNGRLSADILRTISRDAPGTYERTRLHLVEASAAAREAHRETLGPTADRLISSSATVPDSFEGVLIANELLDAMPVHQVVMRQEGLREIYVQSGDEGLVIREGPLSTPRISEYFADLGITLEPGWRAEVSLAAIDWVHHVTRRLRRGFAIFIDYGHVATALYSVTHSAGTLTTFARHTSVGSEASVAFSPAARGSDPSSGSGSSAKSRDERAALREAPWLRNPGEQDLTAHVDFTSVRRAAEAEGCTMLGFLDQMYFLMALGAGRFETLDLKERLALKTLVLPGGLGSTMKVLILGKEVGVPTLIGCPSTARLT